MKTFYIGFLTFFLTFSYAMQSVAQLPDPLLVLDLKGEGKMPVKFRTSADAITDANINIAGFAHLNIAGSAQFGKADLSPILAKLKTEHLVVIDLRNESHGFLNQNAISWYGHHNAMNADKWPDEVKKIEANLLDNLSHHNKIDVYKILLKNKDGIIQKAEPIAYQVNDVQSEKDVVTNQHLDYQRFYVEDFHAPTKKEAKRFVKFVKSLPAHEWLYFHCRGGSGRTTTFMVMFDMLRNAKTVSFDDILTRHKAIGGKDLRQLPAQDSYKYKFAVERLNFLKDFYEYARQH